MAAYRRVYDSRHLQADCQEPRDQPRNHTLGNRVWATFTFICGRPRAAAGVAFDGHYFNISMNWKLAATKSHTVDASNYCNDSRREFGILESKVDAETSYTDPTPRSVR